jgi:hypothetical protein
MHPIDTLYFRGGGGGEGVSSNSSDNAHHSSLQPDRVEILRALLWNFLCGGPHIIPIYVFSFLSLPGVL